MTLSQSYVLLAVAIVVALTNLLGAYFAVRNSCAKRSIAVIPDREQGERFRNP
jgi:hypothetical protein